MALFYHPSHAPTTEILVWFCLHLVDWLSALAQPYPLSPSPGQGKGMYRGALPLYTSLLFYALLLLAKEVSRRGTFHLSKPFPFKNGTGNTGESKRGLAPSQKSFP